MNPMKNEVIRLEQVRFSRGNYTQNVETICKQRNFLNRRFLTCFRQQRINQIHVTNDRLTRYEQIN